MVLLDTHVLIWFAEDSPHLGKHASAIADAALLKDEVLVATISFRWKGQLKRQDARR